MRFVCLLLFGIGFCGVGAGQAHTCEETFAKAPTKKALKRPYDIEQLREDINISTTSRWKKNLLFRILKSEAEMGNRIIVVNDTLLSTLRLKGKSRFPLPYGLAIPREVIEGVVTVAKSHGLKPSQRYVVLPAKMFAANGVKHFYSHLLFVLGLGVSGEILDSMNFVYKDPVYTETDPDDVGDDEHILILNMMSGENLTAAASSAMIKLAKFNNKKLVVINMTRNSGVNYVFPESTGDLLKRRFERGLQPHKDKKFKKIIIAGHGDTGKVIFEQGKGNSENFAIPLSWFGDVMASVKKQMAPNAEIHFSSCLAAANVEAEEEVKKLGNAFFEKGGEVHASRLLLNFNPVPQKATLFFSPVLAATADGLFGLLDRSASSFNDKDAAFKGAEFVYRVPPKTETSR